MKTSTDSEREKSPSGYSQTSSLSQNKSENFNVFQNEVLSEEQIREIAKKFIQAQQLQSEARRGESEEESKSSNESENNEYLTPEEVEQYQKELMKQNFGGRGEKRQSFSLNGGELFRFK